MSDGDVAIDSAKDDNNDATSGGVNTGRRYFLIQATSAVAAVGAVGAAWPFVKYWTPSAKARAAGAPVKIDFSKLAPGEMLSPIVAWRGKPSLLCLATKHLSTHSNQILLILLIPILSTQSNNQSLQSTRGVLRSLRLVFTWVFVRT